MKKVILILVAVMVIGLVGVGCPTASYTLPDEPLEILNDSQIIATWNLDYDYKGISMQTNYPDVEWVVVENSLPQGLQFDCKNGRITGVPTELGTSGILTVKAVNGEEVAIKTFNVVVIDAVWFGKGLVTVDNFTLGVSRVEYFMKVHNDYSVINERKIVTTEEIDIPDSRGFVTVNIPINQALHGNDVSNVLSVTSDLETDELQILRYDVQYGIVEISGFSPLTTRTIEVIYVADSQFRVYYMTKDLDVGQYVTISDTSFVLKPHETKEILITLEIPEGAIEDVERFEFYLVAGKIVSAVGGMKVTNECKAVWVVNMR